jgi:hypothetical protein
VLEALEGRVRVKAAELRGRERDEDLTVLCRNCHELFSQLGRLHANPQG